MKTITASASNVTTAGTIVTLNVPAGFRRFRMDEVRIRQTAGDATATQAIVSTDTAASTPGTVDEAHTIVSYDDELIPLNAAAPWTDDNNGDGYSHRLEDTNGEFDIHLIPNAGTNNNYAIEVLIGRRF